MAVDLITTPGADDANGYAEEDFVQARAEEMAGAGAVFNALDTNARKGAIISASTDIDSLPLLGRKNDPDQAMQFPRFPSTAIDLAIQKATAILAVERAPAYTAGSTSPNPFDVTSGNGNVQEETIAVITTKFFKPTTRKSTESDPLGRFSDVVAGLLRPYVMKANTTPRFGTGTAYRGS
jgi:hypothetical protein